MMMAGKTKGVFRTELSNVQRKVVNARSRMLHDSSNAAAYATLLEHRGRMFKIAYEAGMSYRAIARATGLSAKRVEEIIKLASSFKEVNDE